MDIYCVNCRFDVILFPPIDWLAVTPLYYKHLFFSHADSLLDLNMVVCLCCSVLEGGTDSCHVLLKAWIHLIITVQCEQKIKVTRIVVKCYVHRFKMHPHDTCQSKALMAAYASTYPWVPDCCAWTYGLSSVSSSCFNEHSNPGLNKLVISYYVNCVSKYWAS